MPFDSRPRNPFVDTALQRNVAKIRSGDRVALAVGLALTLLVSAPLLSEQAGAPRNLRIVPPESANGVLSASDLSYLGSMRIPSALAYGSGALAGRTTNGQVSFFMLNQRGEAYEFNYVGHAIDPYAAPTAPVLRYWGWVTWNGDDQKNLSWDYSSGAMRSSKTNGNPWPFYGLAYHNGYLYTTYLDYYNSNFGLTDHCLVATDLSRPDSAWAFGPYRFNGTSVKHLCGNLLVTPRGLGMVGSMMALSVNPDNSWGPALWVMPYPIGSTPGGYQSPKLSPTPLLDHDISERSPRDGDYRPDPYNRYNPDIVPVNGQGFWTQRDRMSTAAWIQTSSGKAGILFMGGMATGQIWYGSYDNGPDGATNRCKSADRGENAAGFRPEWRIYSPADLTGNNLKVAPKATFNPRSLPNGDSAGYACEQYITGAYFDQASSKLFLAGGYDPSISGLTVINVWHVKP